MIAYSEKQLAIAKQFQQTSNFLEGPAGSGKTTLATAHLLDLIQAGIPGDEILVLVPQRSLGLVYQEALLTFEPYNNTLPTIQTMGGIAQRAVRLFWPLVQSEYAFSANTPPNFLTLETAQYYLAKVCEPLFNKGYFETVHIDRNRVFSQILDNLEKAAINGFDYQTTAARLRAAWAKEPEHVTAFHEAQEAAINFRSYCLENNLLDFSLQYEIFANFLWKNPDCQTFLREKYRYLIFDNCEETPPMTHMIIKDWLPSFESSLIIYDQDAGLRAFLGADPNSAYTLRDHCQKTHALSGSWIASETIQQMVSIYNDAINFRPLNIQDPEILHFVQFSHNMYYPKMIDEVTEKIRELIVDKTVPANEIAILAPFVSDALRFQIQTRFEDMGINLLSHRPSRSLREEASTHVMLTWAKLAHPGLAFEVNKYELRNALLHSILALDPLRADLMTQVVFSKKKDFVLNDTSAISIDMLNRFTLTAAEQYETLRGWLLEYSNDPVDLDIFFARLFGEVLSQPGFGYAEDFNSAEKIANLIESVQKFRRVTESSFDDDPLRLTKEFIEMIESGTLAAAYLDKQQLELSEAVYLAPAHTFLMQNRPVQYQFWLDIGSQGWWQRLMQPLTQPYVLSNNWNPDMKWTDTHEYQYNQLNLSRLVTGLLRRCGKQVFMYTAGYNERGDEERGHLLQAVQRLLRYRFQELGENSHV